MSQDWTGKIQFEPHHHTLPKNINRQTTESRLVLVNHSIVEATAVAERARRALESDPVAGLTITASFGVSAFPECGREPAALIKTADTALYDAKNYGRNLVRIVGEPKPVAGVQRTVDRKEASVGGLTEQQKRALRLQYFQSGVARCPEDNSILNVIDTTTHGSIGKDLAVMCPMCGLGSELPGGSR